MSASNINITIIEDAADITSMPRSQEKLTQALRAIFQEYGIIVSIDYYGDEPTRKTGTDG
jgi:hypothetical protein